jgi:hypothetical protein
MRSLTGSIIKTISINDTDRDFILLAMWVWRDILVTMMAEGNMTDNQVISLLKDIRATVGESLYSDLLDLATLHVPESETPQWALDNPTVTNAIHVSCPHWNAEQTQSLVNLRRLYHHRNIANFYAVPNTALYKHIAINSPASKSALLGHIDSLWSTPSKIRELKDQQIHVIVGYYLTEHLHAELVKFCNAINKEKCQLPETAALIIVKRFKKWTAYRTYAAKMITGRLVMARDEIAQAIHEVMS